MNMTNRSRPTDHFIVWFTGWVGDNAEIPETFLVERVFPSYAEARWYAVDAGLESPRIERYDEIKHKDLFCWAGE